MKRLNDFIPTSDNIQHIDPLDELAIRNADRVIGRNGVECPFCLNKEVIYELKDDEIYGRWCVCKKQRDYLTRARQSGMGDLLKLTLDDFIATQDWQKQVKSKVVEYLASEKQNWFVALGQVGAGKTTICSVIANEIMKSQKVIYLICGDYLQKVKRLKGDELEDYVNEIKSVEVLYLDDFMKFANVQDVNEMFMLINSRYNEKKLTIISSEKTQQELYAIDEALASRIIERAGDYLITFKKDKGKNQRLKGLEI